MMTPIAVPAAAPGPYGALELKQDYRKHMLLSVLIAAALHLCIVGGILLYQTGLPVPVVEPVPNTPGHEGEVRLRRLPPMTPPASSSVRTRALAKLLAGATPVAMPDELVAEDPIIPTKNDLVAINAVLAQGSEIGSGAAATDQGPAIDDWPDPSVFMAVEEEPVVIHFEMPVYPEMAELTGQSGTVWIQALVDTEGRVRKANVLRDSGSNVGFETAAVDAAFASVYKPAIQNGRPVPVWITYRVDFKLH